VAARCPMRAPWNTNLDRPGAGEYEWTWSRRRAQAEAGVSSRISEGTRVASDRSRSHRSSPAARKR